jgi:hypothetical protein
MTKKSVQVSAHTKSNGTQVKAHSRGSSASATPIDAGSVFVPQKGDYMNPMTRCPLCKINKPTANFAGMDTCGACQSSTASLKPVPKLSDPRAPQRITKKFLAEHGKRCYKCGHTKALKDFALDSSKAYGCGSRCRTCDAAKVRARRMHADGEMDHELAKIVNDLPGHICYLCDQVLYEPIVPEHVIPICVGKEEGGTDSMSNVVPAHKHCNDRKSGKHWLKGPPKNDYEEDLFERMYWRSQELWIEYNYEMARDLENSFPMLKIDPIQFAEELDFSDVWADDNYGYEN